MSSAAEIPSSSIYFIVEYGGDYNKSTELSGNSLISSSESPRYILFNSIFIFLY
jgi:hypothetical protein